MTQVSEVMTRGVRTLAPSAPLVTAARAMQELDVGAIPVCDGERLVGMVTDRDLVLRGIAQGSSPDQTPLRDVMTTAMCWCYDDDSVDEAVRHMRDAQIRRLPIVDRDKHLVGMLSLGDVALRDSESSAGEALSAIAERRPAELPS